MGGSHRDLLLMMTGMLVLSGKERAIWCGLYLFGIFYYLIVHRQTAGKLCAISRYLGSSDISLAWDKNVPYY